MKQVTNVNEAGHLCKGAILRLFIVWFFTATFNLSHLRLISDEYLHYTYYFLLNITEGNCYHKVIKYSLAIRTNSSAWWTHLKTLQHANTATSKLKSFYCCGMNEKIGFSILIYNCLHLVILFYVLDNCITYQETKKNVKKHTTKKKRI